MLVVPAPFWMFGEQGESAEKRLDSHVSGFIQHAAAYAVLTVLCFSVSARDDRRGWWLGAAALAGGHGVATEVLQHFIPHWSFDWRDCTANAVGIVLAAVLVIGMRVLRARHNDPAITDT